MTASIDLSSSPTIPVWEPNQLVFHMASPPADPYCDAEVWVDLSGPGFSRRVYGFWNGGAEFVVRLCAPRPGTWSWRAGSSTGDRAIEGLKGTFTANGQSADALTENPNRRGMIRVTADRRGLEYADGTPFFMIADTWWAVPSFRFPLPKDDTSRGLGPDASIADYIRFRKVQGFNSVGLIAAQPCWNEDGKPHNLFDADGDCVRHTWPTPEGFAKSMHDDNGERPFLFPGKVPGFEDVVPDYDRVNPDYFKTLDKKMDILFEMGIVPFIEVARRDTGPMWKKHHDFPESYARFIHYVFCRYQAHNAIFSPIHYDLYENTIPSREYNAPCNLVVDRWGKPPFGTILSANSRPSSLVNFGGADECRWIDMHQSGNSREHYTYWYLTEIFHHEPTLPALNGEPYYSGLEGLSVPYPYGKPGNTPEDDMYVRSGMYGSLLSGGYAGYFYGCEGIWQASVEPGTKVMMWEGFRFSSAETVRHLKTFAMVKGTAYRELVPEAEHIIPNRTANPMGYEGWSYCAGAKDRSWFLLYFEANCATETYMRGLTKQFDRYRATWFDPRSGAWLPDPVELMVEKSALIRLPESPDPALDWGMMLELIPS